MKTFYVESPIGWFVVKARRKAKALSCGLDEFGSDMRKLIKVRAATRHEAETYLDQKGEIEILD